MNKYVHPDETTAHSRDNGRMKERKGSRKLIRASGQGSYEESPQAVRSRMKREGKWKGDFKATRG